MDADEVHKNVDTFYAQTIDDGQTQQTTIARGIPIGKQKWI